MTRPVTSGTTTDSRRKLDHWLGTAVALASVAILLAAGNRCFASDLAELACTVQDDSYYYLLPAYNFAHHGQWSFDGETTTYGFQPLFALLLSGLALGFEDRFEFLRGALWFSHALHVTAAWGLMVFVRRATRAAGEDAAALLGWIAAALALADHARLLSHTTLKENVLYAVLLPLALRVACAARERPTAHLPALGTGLLLGLTLLTRLTPSSCAVAAWIGVWAMGAGRLPDLARRAGRIAAGAIGILVPWILYAESTFGRVMPTPGAVKTAWLGHAWRDGSLTSRLAENLALVPSYLYDVVRSALGLPHGLFVPQRWSDAPIGGGITAWLTVAGLICAAVGLCRRGFVPEAHLLRHAPPARLVLTLVPITLAFTGLNQILLQPDSDNPLVRYAQWYVAAEPTLFTALAVLGLAWPSLMRHRAWRSTLGAVCVAAVLLAIGLHTAIRIATLPAFAPNPQDAVHQYIVAVRSAAAKLPAASRVGAWNAGVAGFFSDQPLVNLDGLANDQAFAAQRAGTDPFEFVGQFRIDHLLDAVPEHGWFATNAFDRIEYLEVTPFETPTTDGVYLGRVTTARYPDFDPPRSDASVDVKRWLPNPGEGEPILWRNFAIRPTNGPSLRFHTAGRWTQMTATVRSDGPATELTLELDDVVAARWIATAQPQLLHLPLRDAQLVRVRATGATPAWLHTVTFTDLPMSVAVAPPESGPYGESFAQLGRAPGLTLTALGQDGTATLRATELPSDSQTTLVLALATTSRRLPSGARALVADPALLSLPVPTNADGTATLTLPPGGPRGPATVFAQLVCTRESQVVASSRGLRIVLRR